jgi:hypothetical protein
MMKPGSMKSSEPKPLPECAEGPEAFQWFDAAMTKLISVPRAVLMEREAAYRKQVDANPRRRGPKRKSEVLATAQREALAKLQAEKQAIDNKLADVERALLDKVLGRRKRQR